MMQMVHSRFNALLSACVLSLIATVAWSQSLTWLGTLGGNQSRAYGVSADGRVVVGWAENAAGHQRAFRWTASGGMQDLGTLGGSESRAYGVSADGAVVVGWAQNAAGQVRAFRWTASGGMQDLGTLGGNWSAAYGVSADGSVVVGSSNGRAFRWTASGGMQDLGTWGEAYAVSADGSVVVGGKGYTAFRWTASGGIQDLGTLSYWWWTAAYAVSADGSVVVGYASNSDERGIAFRWTASGGMQQLHWSRGSFPDTHAYAVSADGTVMVGRAYNINNGVYTFATRWTALGSEEDLSMTYTLWIYPSHLDEARAISPDGRYIVGYGQNPATGLYEAFLLDTRPRCGAYAGDVNCDGIVDDADLLEVLFNFGNRYR
jgi:probable HAF family extracellular repeat protein